MTETLEQHKLLQGGKALNKEDFLSFLTEECTKNNAELIKFNDLGITEDSGTWKTQFDFELRGTLSAFNNVCQAIDQINIRYSVGGFSLRQNSGHAYLTRFFDENSRLEWYKDDTPRPDENQEQEDNVEPFEVPPEGLALLPPPETEPPISLPPAQTPEPTQEPFPETEKDETITDRLDHLLKQTNAADRAYKITFLTNTESVFATILPSSSEETMLLNITLEFTMYADPKDLLNSFLSPSEAEV